ncbi:MAG: hypothetical protein QHC79_13995 [Pseudosphingobacterium sp.]|nr:hypothetical protein [Olivibacter sp. UJ_SKK_5.1]MDX3914647.1 hypothetical protein [Pseudosphingobacterium sp.]
MSIYELAAQLGLSVSSDNVAEIPIIILNDHLFVSESSMNDLFDLNDTRTMEWLSLPPMSLADYYFAGLSDPTSYLTSSDRQHIKNCLSEDKKTN